MEKKIEKLVDKKREEAIAEVKQDFELAVERAEGKITAFADTLKEAYEIKEIGPEGLLDILEKGGIVYRETVDLEERNRMSATQLVHNLAEGYLGDNKWHFDNTQLNKRQRVTIIIEPLAEGED